MNLRGKITCPWHRWTSTAVGTYTVRHGLSFGTAEGLIGMYEVRVADGDAYVIDKNVDAYVCVIDVAPATLEVWSLGYPSIMGHSLD